MELCSNCFKNIPEKYPFCPFCGSPNVEIGLKQCSQGHIIYETCRTCPICGQITNLGKSLLFKDTRKEMYTELINTNPAPEIDKTNVKSDSSFQDGNKTVLESSLPGISGFPDKTRVESTFTSDRTIFESDLDKTRIDEGITASVAVPDFYAWLVFKDESGKTVHDCRLTKEKNIMGKGSDADIRLSNDFASKLHALIFFEEGHFFLTDLGSTNHTWLNEKKVMKEELKDGDIIRIGQQNMIFKYVRRTQ